MADLHYVVADIRDLRLLNLGVYNYLSPEQLKIKEKDLKNDIDTILEEIDELHSYL
jgi:hypothetical protein